MKRAVPYSLRTRDRPLSERLEMFSLRHLPRETGEQKSPARNRADEKDGWQRGHPLANRKTAASRLPAGVIGRAVRPTSRRVSWAQRLRDHVAHFGPPDSWRKVSVGDGVSRSL